MQRFAATERHNSVPGNDEHSLLETIRQAYTRNHSRRTLGNATKETPHYTSVLNGTGRLRTALRLTCWTFERPFGEDGSWYVVMYEARLWTQDVAGDVVRNVLCTEDAKSSILQALDRGVMSCLDLVSPRLA